MLVWGTSASKPDIDGSEPLPPTAVGAGEPLPWIKVAGAVALSLQAGLVDTAQATEASLCSIFIIVHGASSCYPRPCACRLRPGSQPRRGHDDQEGHHALHAARAGHHQLLCVPLPVTVPLRSEVLSTSQPASSCSCGLAKIAGPEVAALTEDTSQLPAFSALQTAPRWTSSPLAACCTIC